MNVAYLGGAPGIFAEAEWLTVVWGPASGQTQILSAKARNDDTIAHVFESRIAKGLSTFVPLPPVTVPAGEIRELIDQTQILKGGDENFQVRSAEATTTTNSSVITAALEVATSDLLLGYWTGFELEEASGTRYATVPRYTAGFDEAIDLITIVGTTQETGPGGVGNAAGLDGVNDCMSKANCSPKSGLNMREDWTITGWFRRGSTAAISDEAHIYGWQCGGTGETYHTWLDTSAVLHFGVYEIVTSTPISEVTWGTAISTTDWHHMTLRHNAVAKTIALRLDGGSWVTGTAYTGVINNASGPITLGSKKLTDKFFFGHVSGHHFWTRMLTDAQVTQMENGGAEALRYPFA